MYETQKDAKNKVEIWCEDVNSNHEAQYRVQCVSFSEYNDDLLIA
jgi:hypothetical protein